MKLIRITAFILLVQTIAWVILMALSTAQIERDWEPADYIQWASSGGVTYVLNYINVTLLTVLAVLFFSFFYSFLKEDSRSWALAGLVLVPVYGTLNIVVYSMQITLVPHLAATADADPGRIAWISQLIQANPSSLAAQINGMAYAILGIPSAIYGLLLARKSYRISGWLLLSSGILSMVGMIGTISGSSILSAGLVAGGIAFLLFLAAAVVQFRQ
jgi:hypothetical protein